MIDEDTQVDRDASAAVLPFLIVVAGPSRGDYVRVPEGRPLVVGRGSEADLRLDDRHVSRRHAVVRYADGMVWIDDLGSANGTTVSGRLADERANGPGSMVGLGSQTVLKFQLLSRDSARALHAFAQSARRLGSLSRRERDVCDGVADGLTNARIAERLSISPNTVATHLRRIQDKLRTSNRAEVTRVLIESSHFDLFFG